MSQANLVNSVFKILFKFVNKVQQFDTKCKVDTTDLRGKIRLAKETPIKDDIIKTIYENIHKVDVEYIKRTKDITKILYTNNVSNMLNNKEFEEIIATLQAFARTLNGSQIDEFCDLYNDLVRCYQ